MQFASAGNFYAVQIICIFYTQADVCVQFFEQSVSDLSGSNVFAFLTCKGAVIYREVHCQCRFGNFYKRQCFRFFGRTDGIANGNVFDTAQGNDITNGCFFYFYSLQTFELVQFCDSYLFLCFCIMHIQNDNFVVYFQCAVFDLTDTDTTQIFAVVDGGDQCLCRGFHIACRCRNVVDDGFKQRFHIPFSCGRIFGSVAASCRSEYKGGIQLIVICIQFHEQFQNFIDDIIRSCFRSVNFIYTNHYGMVQFQRFAQNEFCLGHGAFKGIYHQNNAVYHFQYTFYFAAEVCVAGCIDDIDLHITVIYCCVFGKDRDPSFPFNIAAVHNTFLYRLIGTEDPALFQELVNQCGFTVVNMGNNGYISDIFNILLHIKLLRSCLIFLLRTTVYYSTAPPCTQSFHQKKYACIQGKTGTFKDIFHKKNDDPVCSAKSSFYSFFKTLIVPFSTSVTNSSAS